MKRLLEQFYLNLISYNLNKTAICFLACMGNLYVNTSTPQGNKNRAHSSGIRVYLQTRGQKIKFLYIYIFIYLYLIY
jgi:hypothetical protein